MKPISLKKLIFLIFILAFAFFAYLNFSYWRALLRYQSLSGSGVRYSLKDQVNDDFEGETTIIKPASTRFGLVITELGINQKVVQEVDHYETKKLDQALSKGLTHLAGSSLPGDFGAVLIIGHPLSSFFNINHTNPDFYLIGRLKKGDKISIFYNELEFVYQVEETSTRSPGFLDFFDPSGSRRLILVSGYPPGTALRFLVVEAKEIY